MPAIADFGLRPWPTASGWRRRAPSRPGSGVTDALVDYIVDVIRATREHAAIETGASTRAANMMAAAVRAYAALNGRDFVIPDDIKALAVPLLRHRVILAPNAEIDGLTSDRVLREILDQTVAPR